MSDKVTAQEKNSRLVSHSGYDFLITDAFLGSLIVLFTVATAFAAYKASTAEIRGNDLDINAQNALIHSMASYQESNLILMEDNGTYTAYRLLKESDPEAVEVLLETASPEMTAGLARPDGPFDVEYEAALYREARDLLAEAEALQEEGNVADDLALHFQGAAFILAIGLAITAWASLFDSRPTLRLIFTLLALPCLIIGLGLVAASVVG